MVTKSQIVICLGVFTVCFALVQLYLLYRAPRLYSIQDQSPKSTTHSLIRNFLNYCDTSNINCILVDSNVLESLVVEPITVTALHSCKYLCKDLIYTFAIKDSEYKICKMEVLPRMRKDGYIIRATFSERLKSDIPTHVHLHYLDNYSIHLVIFHKRRDWWWYGPDNEVKTYLDFTKTEGVLDQFDNEIKVVLDGIDVYVPQSPAQFLTMYNNSHFLPCNKTRAQLFHNQYPRDTSENAAEFRQVAAKAIATVKSRLDAYGVPFWLSSGTLLGWFRQCDFIPYSVDVDIGVFIKDHREGLLQSLQSSLTLDHKFGKVEDSLQYAFDMGKVKLDIFFFYEDEVNGKMWNGGTDYNTGDKFKYLFERFTLCWTDFYDMKLRVPCETETYIKANYGQNWFTPVKHWDWSKSPPNVFSNGEWKDDELDEVIQLWDKKGKRIPLEWTRE